MYIRREEARDSLSIQNRKALGRIPMSYIYDTSMKGIAEFGQSLPKPVLLTHYHRRQFLSGGTMLLTESRDTVMTAEHMRPHYRGGTDPQHGQMQRDLIKLIYDKHWAAVSPKVQLRITLVDLTQARYHTPVFAGFWSFNANNPGEGATIEGGSLVKMLALYALYQLRFDLNIVANEQGITKGGELQVFVTKEWQKAGLPPQSQPKLASLFRFVEKAGSPVEAKLLRTPSIHGNLEARLLVLALGFEYIGSVALQSGLFDEKQGGLWLNAAYLTPRITWNSSPFPQIPRHSATAASAATFFTLLAQGRLVNWATSHEIANVLKSVKCLDNGLLDGVKLLPGAEVKSSNKCGIREADREDGRWAHGPLYHEAIHVNRQPPGGKRLEYVAAVLSEEPPPVNFVELGKDLDGIIEKQNP